MAKRKPNFIYIGPDKAGSTWLYTVCEWHPEIYTPEVKELFFFDRYYQRGLDWYLRYFADAGPNQPVLVDISHDYLFDATTAPRMLDDLGPDTKLMVCLREPIDRARSAYLFMRRQGRVNVPFSEAVRTVDELLDHGRYGTLLAPFLERFPREQIFTPYFDDLSASPTQFADDLFRFLGVEPLVLPDDLEDRVLGASQSRSYWVSRVSRRAGVIVRDLGGERLVSKVKSSRLVERTLYTKIDPADRPDAIPPELMSELRAEMQPEVEAIDAALGTSCVKRWGYDTAASGLRG